MTEVLNRVGAELAQDEVFGAMITGAPRVLRVDNFGDSGIEIKVLGETKPLKQWDVAGELRKRIKKAFDEEGIVEKITDVEGSYPGLTSSSISAGPCLPPPGGIPGRPADGFCGFLRTVILTRSSILCLSFETGLYKLDICPVICFN